MVQVAIDNVDSETEEDMRTISASRIVAASTGIAVALFVAGSVGWGGLGPEMASAQDSARPDVLPKGRTASPIEDGKYPASYFPNTEVLGPAEMRIIAQGSGS